jgi:hypothetical protein
MSLVTWDEMMKAPSRAKSAVAAFVAGLASLASFAVPSAPVRLPHETDGGALRSDWLRIGHDFRVVIARENEKLEKVKEPVG